MKVLSAALSAAILTAACTATDTRPMNYGEKTIVSAEVAALVNEKGAIDIRQETDVVCDRVRITGSHMITRHCYTRTEQTDAERANQEAMRDNFGRVICMNDYCSGN